MTFDDLRQHQTSAWSPASGTPPPSDDDTVDSEDTAVDLAIAVDLLQQAKDVLSGVMTLDRRQSIFGRKGRRTAKDLLNEIGEFIGDYEAND